MISTLRNLAVLFAVLLLGACASQPLPMQDGKLAAPPGMGLAVLAVTLDSLDREGATAGVLVTGPAGRSNMQVSILTDYIRVSGSAPDDKGRVFVQALPPGDYVIQKIYGWWFDGGPGLGLAISRYEEVPLDAPFHINAGEVVYLGDAHISLNFRPSAALTDRQKRDFDHLVVRRQVLQTDNIVVRIPKARAAQ
ncbi:hypothetical protein IGB42_02024 [Andreprevotia sp. IGB-42]|uniref:hypothetical protein n=1 Tax=Andreprevotia sp. IGB-42 TaxID=2497473 RepID=UPI00135CA011|nr:hypothetical protein [Andreprevotia sp. IGB-42]KAF0813672.1 hypothetical protein IGB42_02024 [Andreprevotia sp. IGB-42]